MKPDAGIAFLNPYIKTGIYIILAIACSDFFHLKNLIQHEYSPEIAHIKENTELDMFSKSEKIKEKIPTFSASSSTCGITVAIVLCRDEKVFNGGDGTLFHAFDRQITQVLVLLKSVLIAEKYSPDLMAPQNKSKCIHVIVLANYKDIFDNLTKAISDHQNWDPEFAHFLELSYVPAVYSKEYEWMSSVYRPCATIRLFLDTILSDVDAVLYTDTDIIYLKSLQYLWNEFESFTDEMIAGLIPEYDNQFYMRKYYNPSAYNSGIMLMNLTRMRDVEWSRRIGMVCSLYLEDAQWADQDILVIYFQHFRKQLLDISCDWNFAPRNCRFGKICAENGISAVHGLAGSFAKPDFEIYFKKLFDSYKETSLIKNYSIDNFALRLERELLNILEVSHHSCNNTSNFGNLVIKSIQRFQQFDRNQANNATLFKMSGSGSIPIAISLCEDPVQQSNKISPHVKKALALLKSIAIGADSMKFVHVLVLSPSAATFDRLQNATLSWDAKLRRILRITFVPADYPLYFEWMKDNRCSTLGLFLPEILTNQDAVIYLDTNVYPFPRLGDLSSSFDHINYPAILGMQINPAWPIHQRNMYQKGVMLMNLTRMRSAGFSNQIRIIAPHNREEELGSVKDVLGIYFHYFPQQVAFFGDSWNHLPRIPTGSSAITGYNDKRIQMK